MVVVEKVNHKSYFNYEDLILTIAEFELENLKETWWHCSECLADNKSILKPFKVFILCFISAECFC